MSVFNAKSLLNSDFSRPPPPPNYPINQAGPRNAGHPSLQNHSNVDHNKRIANDAGFAAYYMGSNIGPNLQTAGTRPPNAQLAHSETSAPAGSRMYSVAPPLLPSANMYHNSASPSPYGLGDMNMYGYNAPMSMGAGQYVNQNQGNYRAMQYQGKYGNGSNKRGGFNNNRKRPQENDFDGSRKMPKKKKKPLSQNMPSKKDWTLEDAQKALDVERDFNKRHKSPSLIIKFPDLELNREIVSKFHSKIESVHFQQPSTPRYCFVTLNNWACMDEVITDLQKIKFGNGYLIAEKKVNKEEDSVKGPEDIDPLTLYVGNLAQEVTVDDVKKAYPKHKRVDIGFAKKMKYTRYAFICFNKVDDAIEAFQNTHSSEMYNKSLIVRFRRLHGTVGLPGDAKPQNAPKLSEAEPTNGNNTAAEVPRVDETPSMSNWNNGVDADFTSHPYGSFFRPGGYESFEDYDNADSSVVQVKVEGAENDESPTNNDLAPFKIKQEVKEEIDSNGDD
ncbi:uncharacterized protein LOC109537512 isoform X2 [Dendroctonus ponderosae]|uniref:RRM domain-containing protein n=1 Tax=Dendroctonus ponderosae TaxID=77166 RepID=A0AAR5PFL4_DENPD|nr:uncharacterized protein LOC109537512 isoform X2 [Dendroctonus ponderosae]KAH1013523.1 hypothetical protein HUJ04_002507 [Dendroctonus ponderosae]KAH1024572.1 hypothetical protein HUJ05_004034 [Dendroctonus ponderosae]